MAALNEIREYLDRLLELENFPGDHSNNGLQVEGRADVRRILFSVDSSMELFERAVRKKADMILAHHGLSWGGGFKRLTGLAARRVGALLKSGVSLYAAHLPLDAHPRLGNNARLADFAGLKNRRMFAKYDGALIGVAGALPRPRPGGELAGLLAERLDADHVVLGDPARKVKKIGVISGGGGHWGVQEAMDAGLDMLITGEAGHEAFHLIRESGLTVAVFGHYKSETPGPMALMEDVGRAFDVECEFVDIPTGM